MQAFQKGWYLLYTKPRHEKKVYNRLTEMSIGSFLPLQKKLRLTHDRKRYVDEPLFPSYVFIYLKDLQNYYTCIDTDGALFYVKVGKEIAKVNESVINNIKLVTGFGADVEVSNNHFLEGKKLVIGKGPLTGLSCEVIRVEKKQKLLVRVDMLKRNILVSLPQDYLLDIPN